MANVSIDETILDQLLALEEVQPGFFKQILQMFEDSVPEALEILNTAADERSYETLKLKAHALKGSSANIGAQQVAKTCADIVELAKEQTDM